MKISIKVQYGSTVDLQRGLNEIEEKGGKLIGFTHVDDGQRGYWVIAYRGKD